MTSRLLRLTIALLLVPAHTLAATMDAAPPAAAMELIEKYVTRFKAPAPEGQQGVFAQIGRDGYARATALQVARLEPEDFNLTLLYLMSRFIAQADERQLLFTGEAAKGPRGLINHIRDGISADLTTTRYVEEGPGHFIIEGTYAWYTWAILFGGTLAWRRIALLPAARSTALMQEIQRVEHAAASARPLYRIPYRAVSHPLPWAMAAGGFIGYLGYILEKNRTRRLDPVEILNVVQAQLACALSYRGLELHDRVIEADKSDDVMRTKTAELLKEALDINRQTATLAEQYPELDNLDVAEEPFKKKLSRLPPADSFQSLRKNLSEAQTSEDGRCRQISLTHLKIELDKIIQYVRMRHLEFNPPPPKPPQEQEKP